MKDSLQPGLAGEQRYEVDNERTIEFMGDELRVYGTPYMVRDIEEASRLLVQEHLDDGTSATVSGEVTANTALDTVRREVSGHGLEPHVGWPARLRDRNSAVRTQRANESLRRRTGERFGQFPHIDAEIPISEDRGRRVDGVKRRGDQVPGERGLHHHGGRFLVAGFSDQDDLGILPEDGPQGAGEVQSCPLVDLNLNEPGTVELDGVFYGVDVAVRCVEFRQEGVQQRRLSGPRGTGHREDAGGTIDEACAQTLHRVVVQSARFEIEILRLSEDPNHEALRLARGKGADPQVVVSISEDDAGPSVLWLPPDRRVHSTDRLGSRDDGLEFVDRQFRAQAKDSVDAVANESATPTCLSMDVGRSDLRAFGHEAVEDPASDPGIAIR